ncbi:MAG: chloride channel protein [Chloroflexi bacterium]|nr:chloride channel protein [Chloroflexota bacterium]MCY3589610.1 chloride channel protein [Chloroflexota bacterium]MCY3686767.1 chloride channel protein [Chloroflexota bacterium]MDE2709442.1 chloride channel protein [Chloroflexota bacterium]
MSLVRRPSRRFGTRSAQLFWRLPLIGRVRIPRNLAPLLLAGAVGLAAGFAAVALTAVVDGLTTVFNELASILDGLAGGWTLMLVPAIAAIPVAFVVSRIASESQGAGVPYVMVAVERAGGFVRPIIAPAKLVATGFTLGGGGAAGREGPIVLIAASVASSIGRLARQPSDMLVLMVAAAAAGGIAATFLTPIAGTFFAMEVVLRRFNVRNFTIVVVSAVVANIVAISFYGDSAGLDLPDLDINSNWELFLHAIVGVSAAIAGILFVRTRFFTEDVFEFLGVSLSVRPILGLLGVGMLALIESNILGAGLDQIRIFAEGGTAVSTLAILMVLKLIAASLTIGSGASGGAFAPLLFVGATLGALMGAGFESALPNVVGPTGTYVVVGMAAVFAAAARAPLTSLFIVFELSGYSLILPLMTAVALAAALAQLLTRDTIYNVRLRRAGLDVRDEPAPSPLDDLVVAATMRTDTPIVSRLATIQDLANAMSQSRGNVVAVADQQNRFIGLVTATDVASAVERQELNRRAFDLAVVAPIFVHPDDSLRHALSLLVEHDVRQLPVVAREDESRLMGMLTQRDVLREVAQPAARDTGQRAAPTPVRRLVGAVEIELRVEPGSQAEMTTVSQLPLPEASVITAIHRRGEVVIPRGSVRLEANDLAIILSVPPEEAAVRTLFINHASQTRNNWWFLPHPPSSPDDESSDR